MIKICLAGKYLQKGKRSITISQGMEVQDMAHYRQILVNMSVDDHADSRLLEELTEQLQSFLSEKTSGSPEIEKIEVKLN